MTQGLRVFDASGAQLLNVTDRITRLIQSIAVTSTQNPITISVPDLVLDGTFFVHASSTDFNAAFTTSITTGAITIQRLFNFSGTINVLVFRA